MVYHEMTELMSKSELQQVLQGPCRWMVEGLMFYSARKQLSQLHILLYFVLASNDMKSNYISLYDLMFSFSNEIEERLCAVVWIKLKVPTAIFFKLNSSAFCLTLVSGPIVLCKNFLPLLLKFDQNLWSSEGNYLSYMESFPKEKFNLNAIVWINVCVWFYVCVYVCLRTIIHPSVI